MNLPCETQCEPETTMISGKTRHAPVLSRRQQEILQATCEGLPDKQIAEQLGVSPRTLEGHWRAIHRKLGSLNRCQAGFIFAALRQNPQGVILA
jgi:DNA-binding NarL/FixJ family response regulator